MWNSRKRGHVREMGKISAQPHTTLCIQFLNRENNNKNNTFPLGKQICFTTVWGCAETLPWNVVTAPLNAQRNCEETFRKFVWEETRGAFKVLLH